MRKSTLLHSQSLYIHLPFFLFVLLLISIKMMNTIWTGPRNSTLIPTSGHNEILSLCPPQLIQNIQYIELSNELSPKGIQLIKQPQGYWQFADGTKAKLNKVFLETITSLTVKRTLPGTPMNLKNYSIINPIAKITWKTQAGEMQLLNFGIYNSIDRSVYVTKENLEQKQKSTPIIYQVHAESNFNLVQLTSKDFIESQNNENLSTIPE